MERARENEAEGVFFFDGPTRTHFIGPGQPTKPTSCLRAVGHQLPQKRAVDQVKAKEQGFESGPRLGQPVLPRQEVVLGCVLVYKRHVLVVFCLSLHFGVAFCLKTAFCLLCILSQGCVLPQRFKVIAVCLKVAFCLCVLKSLRFGFEGCDLPPSCVLLLRFDNYVLWSSRIIRYARSRPNGKMIVDSIENGPYVRRMIATPEEPDLPVPVPESFHEQTNEELKENDIKRMDTDNQAIQTILLGLPEDVYAAVDSCETAKEIWERVRQMMKGSDIGE
nr:hypothetical protein [Tanacetum cinerariifolium]